MSEAKVTNLEISYPDAEALTLKLAVGACRLKVRAGDGDSWVTGTYSDPTDRLPARLEQDGGILKITQDWKPLDFFGLIGGIPTFDLVLGKARPYALILEFGAGESFLDLGGLPIRRLSAKNGAGRTELDFSVPNPEQMEMLELGTGAGGFELKNLLNANFSEMRLDGGAASYKVDFGGTLQRDAKARIQTGVSSVELVVPGDLPVKITSEQILAHLEADEAFIRKENGLLTKAASEGGSPLLTIHTSVALGSLRVRSV